MASEMERVRLREDSEMTLARGALRAYRAAALATTIAAAAVDNQKRSEQSLTQRHALGGGRAMHSLSVRFTLACPCGRPVNNPPRQDGLLGLRGEPGCDASEEEEPGGVSGIEERQLAR